MLSVILNIITIVMMVAVVSLFFMIYSGRKNKEDTVSDVFEELRTDPLVVGRSYFLESLNGPTGSFGGYYTVPVESWISGFPVDNTIPNEPWYAGMSVDDSAPDVPWYAGLFKKKV